DGERKCASKQDRARRFPCRRCQGMEISSEDRHHYRKSLQRIAHRDFAKTEACGVPDSLGCFSGARASVGLRAKDKSNRRGGDATSREMARDLGEANNCVIPEQKRGTSQTPVDHPNLDCVTFTAVAGSFTVYAVQDDKRDGGGNGYEKRG